MTLAFFLLGVWFGLVLAAAWVLGMRIADAGRRRQDAAVRRANRERDGSYWTAFPPPPPPPPPVVPPPDWRR